jgi:hypothetical protein
MQPTTITGTPSTTAANGRSASSPVDDVLRDIARGGVASLVVGLLVAGVGGRVVMRLAAILVPNAVGAFTENGFRIGDITLPGSLGLIFTGLFLGPFTGVVWVVVSPWIPGAGLARAILTMPIAVALGTLTPIRSENRDFTILDHDPAVVAALLALVALVGLSIALVDDWLDRRLPQAAAPPNRATSVYAVLTLLGAILVFPVVLMSYFEPGLRLVGLALVVVGLCTLAGWVLRSRGQAQPPKRLRIVGRTALLAAVVLGFAAAVQEVSGALGMA